MAQKVIKGSNSIAQKIRSRRNELNLTIEEAAHRAGIGIKTWCRYESGESIRQDKIKGVCKALNWRVIPDEDNDQDDLQIKEYVEHEAWSTFLADNFGKRAAISFVIGSDMLLDYLEQDISDLSQMPVGSHIGQLSTSFIKDDLPPQFLLKYDYEFLYKMLKELKNLKKRINAGTSVVPGSVIEELIIYICNEQAHAYIELTGNMQSDGNDESVYYDEWVFDLFGDCDIITFLYSDIWVDEKSPYCFTHWFDRFYS